MVDTDRIRFSLKVLELLEYTNITVIQAVRVIACAFPHALVVFSKDDKEPVYEFVYDVLFEETQNPDAYWSAKARLFRQEEWLELTPVDYIKDGEEIRDRVIVQLPIRKGVGSFLRGNHARPKENEN